MTAEERLSPDGSIRVVTRPGYWPEQWQPRHGLYVMIYDAASGAVLGDLRAATKSAVRWREDGSFLLDFSAGASNIVFIVEPAARRFRVAGREAEPIADLQARIDAERETLATGFHEVAYSPDGAIRIDYHVEEWRMSQWCRCPTVTELATGRVLLAFGSSDWDATTTWHEDGSFDLGLRRYTQGGYIVLRLDPPRGTCSIVDDEARPHPIGEARSLAEAAFKRAHRRYVQAYERPSGPRGSPRQTLISILIGLLIVGVIAAGSYAYDRYERAHAPPPVLAKIPEMPKMPSTQGLCTEDGRLKPCVRDR